MPNDFVEPKDEDFSTQLNTSALELVTYGPGLGFTGPQITAADDDADFFDYLMDRQNQIQSFAETLSGYKKLARYGDGAAVLPAAIPFPTAYPLPLPTAVAANIEARFRQRAQQAKAHPAYTKAIGEILRFEKPTTVFDPLTGTPTFKITLNNGHPRIKFVKGRWQGAEIWRLKPGGTPGPVNPNDPGFVKVDRVFESVYTDMEPLPPSGDAEVWVYKLIYLWKGQPVGTPSALLPIKVGGL